jgi:hypothetical protein
MLSFPVAPKGRENGQIGKYNIRIADNKQYSMKEA